MTGNTCFLYSRVIMNINKALAKIRKFYLSQKRLPTYEEMKDLFGYASKRTAFTWTKKLIEAGFLQKDERGRLTPKNLFAIPHLGIIKAGIPTDAYATFGDSVDFYHYILGDPEEMFSLTVKGDSMKEEGINEGDMVIVERYRRPRDGDVVVANVDGEFTVKYYRKSKNGSIYLQPANAKYKNIYPKGELTIGGVVTSVIRKYH